MDKNNTMNVVTVIAAIATVIALGFAIKTEWEIEDILSSLSTKYVGDFSDNMDEINRKLKGAEDSILIISDITAYGCLTAHKKFLDYKQTLINKADSGIISKIYVYTDDLIKDELLTQLESPPLKKIKVDAKEYLDKNPADTTFFKNDDGQSEEDKKKTIIDSIVLPMDKVFRDSLNRFKNVHISNTIENKLPVFVWIIDDEEAVFAFNAGAHLDEITFTTIDKKVIAAVKDIALRHVKNSSN